MCPVLSSANETTVSSTILTATSDGMGLPSASVVSIFSATCSRGV
jgi:hypothetical protein